MAFVYAGAVLAVVIVGSLALMLTESDNLFEVVLVVFVMALFWYLFVMAFIRGNAPRTTPERTDHDAV